MSASDKIDQLLADIQAKDNDIEEVVVEINDDVKEQKQKNKERKKEGKKKKLIIKDTELIRKKEQLEKDKAKMRKQVSKLQKQAGKETTKSAGKGSGAKAEGTGGGNKDGVRCYIRYNNQGNPYRICDDGKVPPPKKPPSKITPLIDPSEFADKYGGYANLSKEQTKTYHRLYMAKQRAEERDLQQGGEDFQDLIKAEKQKKKEIRKLEKLQKEQEVLERKENRKKYNADLAKLGSALKVRKKGDPVPIAVQALRDKYGIKSKVAKTLQQNTEEQKLLQENIKLLEKQADASTIKLKKKVGAVELSFD